MLLGAAALAAELVNHGTEPGFRPAELDLSSVELSAHLGAMHAELLLARIQRRARDAELASQGLELGLHRAHHLECLCHLLLTLAPLLRRLDRQLLGHRLCRTHLGCGRFLGRCHLGGRARLDGCQLRRGRFTSFCDGRRRLARNRSHGVRLRRPTRRPRRPTRRLYRPTRRLCRPTHLLVDLGGRGAAHGCELLLH